MSTTFAVKTPEGKLVEVAFRSNDFRSDDIHFTNDIAMLLPDETSVFPLLIPLDNTNQGIDTIGDIKNAINGIYKDNL